jgi:hypothetical protein
MVLLLCRHLSLCGLYKYNNNLKDLYREQDPGTQQLKNPKL